MKFMTPVALPPRPEHLLTDDSRILLLGSCFAEEVGNRLATSLPAGQTVVNPFGVLYNPASLATALRLLRISPEERLQVLEESLFLGRDGLWHSWLFNSKFSAAERAECLERCTASLSACLTDADARNNPGTAPHGPVCAHAREPLFDILVLTMGPDHCYRLRQTSDTASTPDETSAMATSPDCETQNIVPNASKAAMASRVVANCHKEPAACFEEVLTDGRELVAELQTWLHEGLVRDVVVTVSPYRYAKYGFHASQLSKARLLLLAEQLCQLPASASNSGPTRTPDAAVHYFPAYEILLDELRDYRFYAPDMLHPSPQAADYIFERFEEWAFSPELTLSAAERRKEARRQAHRPLVN